MHQLTRRLAPFLLAALLSLPSVVSAQEAALSLDQALKNFSTAPASATESGHNTDLSGATASRSIGSVFNDWRNTQSQLSNLQSYFDNNDYSNALRQARQYARQAATPEVRQRWTDLITALEAEQKKAELVLAAQIDAALKRLAPILLEATKPAQLDPLIEEIAALQENRGGSTPRTQRLYNRLNNASGFLSQWQEMLYSLEAGDTDSVRQTLRNLSSSSSRDRPLTRTQILAYATALKLDDATLAEATTRIDAFLLRAADTALAARKADAIDPILAELDELKDTYRNQGYESPLRRAHERLENASTFFRQWQDFLAAFENGDERDTRQQLRNLASNTLRHRPVSRAQINARGAALVKELDTETDTLFADLAWTNLAVARDQAAELQEQAYGRRSTELARLVSELDRLIAARAALDAGKAGLGRAALRSTLPSVSTCSAATPLSPALPAPLLALREAWWFEAMPALTGLSELPARQGAESVSDYARRQLDAALAAADWPRAHRFALLERDLAPAGVSPCGERENHVGAQPAAALAAFLKAQKFEQAAQLPAAAEAYRESLAAGAPPALEPLLITRLRALANTP